MGNLLMKKVKKALIATSLAGALVASAGFGTYSWFSAEKSATGTVTNGTLTLGDASGLLFDHAGFAPSQLLMGNWTSFSNTGNLDQIFKIAYDETLNMPSGSLGQYTYQGFVITVPVGYTLSASEKAFYETLVSNYLGGGNPTAAAAQAPELPTGSTVEPFSTQTKPASKQAATASATDTRHVESVWERSLPAGFKIEFIMGVKLSETANNDYQAAVYNGTLKVNSKQTVNNAQY
jgi:spore coat-associated protein N